MTKIGHLYWFKCVKEVHSLIFFNVDCLLCIPDSQTSCLLHYFLSVCLAFFSSASIGPFKLELVKKKWINNTMHTHSQWVILKPIHHRHTPHIQHCFRHLWYSIFSCRKLKTKDRDKRMCRIKSTHTHGTSKNWQ